jgi:hypothetical protein
MEKKIKNHINAGYNMIWACFIDGRYNMFIKAIKVIIAAILVYEGLCYIDILANNLGGEHLSFWNICNLIIN